MNQRKALVIDDEQIVLDSVRKILKEENFEVDVTLGGRQGIELALQKPYDIVLTDVRMPDIGGLIVLRDVKRAKPSLPIIIITGFANVRTAVQAMKLGAADYLEKPFTPEELLRSAALALQAAATAEPESQTIVHKEEIRRVLHLAACDQEFFHNLLKNGADALEQYDLTGPEKLALLTGDVSWIERHIGPLSVEQKQWFELEATYAQLSMEGFF
jgi:DNA-binding NtrC family response regulator